MGCHGDALAKSKRSPVRPGGRRKRFALAICLCLVSVTMCAQEPSQQELRKMARNPFADVIKLPFAPDVYFDAGPYHRMAGDVQVEPLIPIQVSQAWLLIPRVVATAVTYVPDSTGDSGGRVGIGDTVSTFFLTPAHVHRFIGAVGPALLIPTATDSELGAGRWGLGPSLAVLSQPDWGSIGILVQNIWSLPASTKRGPVNQMQLQPMFSYNLADEWYLTTGPTVSADWTQSSSDRWLVPIGGGVGRTFKFGQRPVDANLAIYSNVVRPSQFSPRWQLSFEVTLLFTKHR